MHGKYRLLSLLFTGGLWGFGSVFGSHAILLLIAATLVVAPCWCLSECNKAGGYLVTDACMWVSSHSTCTVRQMIDAFVMSCIFVHEKLG